MHTYPSQTSNTFVSYVSKISKTLVSFDSFDAFCSDKYAFTYIKPSALYLELCPFDGLNILVILVKENKFNGEQKNLVRNPATA